mmetsp:Transcript_25962/g.70217  ORF Transcript_25962/g.70217 Transcript_25962/m.70217 type:complete len:212 (+) Transcript_25962:105-740(+)
MFAERELVPFFPTEGSNVETTPTGSPRQSAPKRTRRAKKGLATDAQTPEAPAAAKDTPAASAASKGKKGKSAKLVEAARTAAQETPQAKGGKKAASPCNNKSRGSSPENQTPSGKPAFAGAAFEQSPHPSSLPKPSFMGGQQSPPRSAPSSPPRAPDAQAATQHLRSLLGVVPAAPLPEAAAPPPAPEYLATGHDPMATQHLCSLLGVKAA